MGVNKFSYKVASPEESLRNMNADAMATTEN